MSKWLVPGRSAFAPKSLQEKFWEKIEKTGESPGGCWLWLGAKQDGYGFISNGYGSHPGYGRKVWAHRLALEFEGREIPEGMVVDHLCRVRNCANPDHLRVVTPSFNSLNNSDSVTLKNKRKTTCLRGHSLAADNVYVDKKAKNRRCKQCHGRQTQRYHQRKKAEAVA